MAAAGASATSSVVSNGPADASPRAAFSGTVIALCGPTGVGKTAVGVEVAKRLSESGGTPSRRREPARPSLERPRRHGGRVICCDSMQVYRGFPVLTTQPTMEEIQEVPHELVGFVDPGEEFSLVAFAEQARRLLAEDCDALGWALLVGGTGLYLRAALAPLATGPGPDPAVRARLEERANEQGLAVLHDELARLDPAAADAIDARNARRVIRALEAVIVSGRAWSGRDDLWAPAYYLPTLVVGLVLEREQLYRRIDARAARIVDGGAIEEVRRFREERGSERARPGSGGISEAIGYREISRFLDGEQNRDETVAQMAAATRRYARRQLTWLRKVRDAVIIDTHERSPREVAQEVLALALSGEHTKGPHLP